MAILRAALNIRAIRSGLGSRGGGEQNKDVDRKVIRYLITAVTDEVVRLG